MTVIRPNSISGVSSITGNGGDISIFRADGTAADVTVNNITSGVVTATTFSGTTGTFSGNLGVGGVLTYEDVANIDAVGVITARSTVSIADSIVHTGDTNTSLRFPSADTITAETGGSERLRITSAGHVSIGHAGDVATSNGGIGRKFGLRSTANNFIVGETTQTAAHYGIYIEARQTGRSGGARIAQFGLRNDGSGNGVISFQTAPNGADVTERIIIDSAGHLRPVANATYDLGVSGAAWRNLYVNDAHFSNEGGSNSVDGTWGSWTLQEGENDIFMINNRTGKKYAITMREVE